MTFIVLQTKYKIKKLSFAIGNTAETIHKYNTWVLLMKTHVRFSYLHLFTR